MKKIQIRNYCPYRIIFISLLVIVVLLIGFFISRNYAIRTAVVICDSSEQRVMDQSFNTHASINIYSNASYTPFRTVGHFPFLPIWIVDMDADWKLYGGPVSVSDVSELPLIIFDRCTVIVNAITGDIIRVDFPTVE